MATDLADFFFRRDYFYSNSLSVLLTSKSVDFRQILINYAIFLLKLTECNDKSTLNLLIESCQPFERHQDSVSSSFLLIKLKNGNHLYVNEKILNLIVYLVLVVIEKLGGSKDIKEFETLSEMICLNSDLNVAINDFIKRKIFSVVNLSILFQRIF